MVGLSCDGVSPYSTVPEVDVPSTTQMTVCGLLPIVNVPFTKVTS